MPELVEWSKNQQYIPEVNEEELEALATANKLRLIK